MSQVLSLVTVLSAKFSGSKLNLFYTAVKASLLNVLAAAVCYFRFFCIATDIVRVAKAQLQPGP